MKKLAILTVLLFPLSLFSQYAIWADGEAVKVKNYAKGDGKKGVINVFEKADAASVPEDKIVRKIEWMKQCPNGNSENEPFKVADLEININCGENTVTCFPTVNKDNRKTFHFCPKTGAFVDKASDCPSTEDNNGDTRTTATVDYLAPIITYPVFHSHPAVKVKRLPGRKDVKQTLYVDGGNLSELVIANGKTKKGQVNLTEKRYLRSGMSISILGTNFPNYPIEVVTVSVEGEEYSYSQDVQSLYDMVKPSEAESDSNGSKPTKGDDGNGNRDGKNALSNYLKTVASTLTYDHLNLDELLTLQAYQKKLKEEVEKLGVGKLGPKEWADYTKIISFIPPKIGLTPVPQVVPDADEVEVKMAIRKQGDTTDKEYNLGTYRVRGGLAISVNASLMVTGLYDGEVYTDTLGVPGELRAELEKPENALTVGIGTNAEMAWRTGRLFRPTLNLGFFIPLGEEDIEPYISFGPGFNIGTSKVKFSAFGGIAAGKVTDIKPRYMDRDLSAVTDITNTDLSHKVWKLGWMAGIGLSFNLKNNDN